MKGNIFGAQGVQKAFIQKCRDFVFIEFVFFFFFKRSHSLSLSLIMPECLLKYITTKLGNGAKAFQGY